MENGISYKSSLKYLGIFFIADKPHERVYGKIEPLCGTIGTSKVYDRSPEVLRVRRAVSAIAGNRLNSPAVAGSGQIADM
jgi:hypothetical protein